MSATVFAAIDIGSYEIGMKIFEISKKPGLHVVNDVRYPLELGTESFSVGRLNIETVDKICAILQDFKRIMAEFGTTQYRACATSAFRELNNPAVVIEQVFVRTGIHIDILSNAEQHFLGYKSIAAMEKNFKMVIQKGTAILDVGSGSIQVSLFDNDALVSTQNLKLGSMRIRERLRDLEKTTPHYDQLVSDFIRNDLGSYQRLQLKDRSISNVIMMGDFLTETIFKEEVADNIITKAEFDKRYVQTVDKTDLELSREMDIDPDYASLVVPTLVIIKSFLEIFNAESIWVPGVSLHDGIAYDYAEKNKLIKSTHDFENDILVAARNIAKRYSSGKNHIQGTTELAMAMFDGMKKIHGMGKRERLLLRIAVQLHDCGKYISIGDVAECSYNIIMATEIIGLSTAERRIIADVVRYNNTKFIFSRAYEMELERDPSRSLLVAKLAAILRLANALDRSHHQKVKGLKAALKDRELSMVMDSDEDISFELGLLKDKVEFFEEVFGIRLNIRRKKG
ncbi:MAG: HD domain-containing protein [Lachnospiraceae bacterium]|nr:HD domain-containing protein [Blautia sp.]MBR2842648.1 HD domain-containing protein [Lachnospiraceae bacterium]